MVAAAPLVGPTQWADAFGVTRVSRSASGLAGEEAYVDLMTSLVAADATSVHPSASMIPGVHVADPVVVVPLPPTVYAGAATLGGAMAVTAWRRRRTHHRTV
ncbi:MAG: hypothetical protein KF745_01580 [Phycisphaeraceae bacterium]|nr:hypothetical protein [Phycisphaeraceae bacterium]